MLKSFKDSFRPKQHPSATLCEVLGKEMLDLKFTISNPVNQVRLVKVMKKIK